MRVFLGGLIFILLPGEGEEVVGPLSKKESSGVVYVPSHGFPSPLPVSLLFVLDLNDEPRVDLPVSRFKIFSGSPEL